MTKPYTVADITDDLFLTPRLYIIVKIDGDAAWVSIVHRDGDHCGLMQRVRAADLHNVRTMNLLA